MKIDHNSSFIYFVYPFLFKPEQFKSYATNINNATWTSTKGNLQIWKDLPFPSEELLSQVADFLNPRDKKSPTARLWQMYPQTMDGLEGLGGNADWILDTPQGEIPFKLKSVQMSLFKIGVGFLTLTVDSLSGSEQVSDWLNFLHYFRFCRGQRKVKFKSQRATAFDQETQKRTIEPFFPLPAGGIQEHPDGEGTILDVIHGLLLTAGEDDYKEQWWQDVFIPGQLIPYAVLYIDEIDEGEIPAMTYRVRNFFHHEQPIYPAPADLPLDHNALLHYTNNQWFFFSLDGGGFVSFNSPQHEFFRDTLPDHLRKHYFLLFMLALQQRFALMMLENQVAEHWPMDDDAINDREKMLLREEAFKKTQDLLLSFSARGYFVQVMQREHHHRCYRKWQEIFQVERLFKDVNEEIRYMHNSLLAQRTRERQRIEQERKDQNEKFKRRLDHIAWLVGLPVLTLAYINTFEVKNSFAVSTIALVVSLSIGAITLYIINRLSRRKPKD